jgi:hypothetical protein
MSRYGIDYYGIGYYGPTNPVLFDANPFIARPYDYGKILLQWSDPSGGWSRIRLVRNRFGFPVNAWDGDILFDNVNGEEDNEYSDVGPLLPAQFYYYSIFVFETVQYTWSRAADAIGLSVKDYGNSTRLYEYLPEVYKVRSIYTIDTSFDNQDLKSFLALFGFQINYVQTLTDLLIQRYNVEKVGGTLVPTMLKQFGLQFETEVGLQQSRILLRDAIQLYKDKGSSQGLREVVKSFSGYAVPKPVAGTPNPAVDGLVMGHNLMLDYNDSSFEESVGNWASSVNATLRQLGTKTITNASLTANVATITVGTHNYIAGNKIFVKDCPLPIFNSPSISVTITAVTSTTISYAVTGPNVASRATTGTVVPAPTPYEEPTSPANYPNKRAGILCLTNSSASAGTVSISCGASSPVTKGVPIVAGQTYTFSVYATSTTTRLANVALGFRDRFGVAVGLVTSGVAASSTSVAWGTRLTVTATAPANAYYAIPEISVSSVAGSATPEFHYFDGAQLEKSATATEFDEARQIYITPRATRINELKNPHFANPITPWVVTGASTVVDPDADEPGLRTYNVIEAGLTSNVATLTTSNFHELRVGRKVVVKNVSPVFDGQYTITAVTASTFSYAKTNVDIPLTNVTGNAYHAGDSLQLTATSSVIELKSASSSANYMPIHYAGSEYTFSLYAKVDIDTEQVRLNVTWYDSSNVLIQTDTGQAVAVTTSWTRPYVTFTAPTNAAYAVVGLEWSIIGGNVLTVDSALFERTPFLLEFFDGDTGPSDINDLFWEGGTPNAGRSHLYKNRVAVQTRLDEVLRDFLPLGSTFAIFLAQPKT